MWFVELHGVAGLVVQGFGIAYCGFEFGLCLGGYGRFILVTVGWHICDNFVVWIGYFVGLGLGLDLVSYNCLCLLFCWQSVAILLVGLIVLVWHGVCFACGVVAFVWVVFCCSCYVVVCAVDSVVLIYCYW